MFDQCPVGEAMLDGRQLSVLQFLHHCFQYGTRRVQAACFSRGEVVHLSQRPLSTPEEVLQLFRTGHEVEIIVLFSVQPQSTCRLALFLFQTFLRLISLLFSRFRLDLLVNIQLFIITRHRN